MRFRLGVSMTFSVAIDLQSLAMLSQKLNCEILSYALLFLEGKLYECARIAIQTHAISSLTQERLKEMITVDDLNVDSNSFALIMFLVS